jgi:preprotein translocase subunit YajC
LNWIEILAQVMTTGPATAPAAPPAPSIFLFLRDFGPFLIIIIIFYMLMSGSKRKQEKKRQQMLNELKKNDRIQTIGGILGTVVEVRENDVLVKVDETTNTKIKFSRSAVHRVVGDDEKSESK